VLPLQQSDGSGLAWQFISKPPENAQELTVPTEIS